MENRNESLIHGRGAQSAQVPQRIGLNAREVEAIGAMRWRR